MLGGADLGHAALIYTASNGYLFKDVAIPENAGYFAFDLAVEHPGDGDYLTVSFGDQVVFYEDLRIAGNQDFQTVAPIFVGDFAGKSDTLLFALNSLGEASASILLDNITFFAVVPEPSVLLLLSMGTLAVLAYAWRERRRR